MTIVVTYRCIDCEAETQREYPDGTHHIPTELPDFSSAESPTNSHAPVWHVQHSGALREYDAEYGLQAVLLCPGFFQIVEKKE
jgi:hypothetical protein